MLLNSVSIGALAAQMVATISVDAPVIEFAAGVFSNVDSDAGQWYRDGIAISGETGATYTYDEDVDQGCLIQQQVGGVFSNAIVQAISQPPPIINDFDGPADTHWSALPVNPFTMLGSVPEDLAKYTINGSGIGQTTAGLTDRTNFGVHDTGSPHHWVELVVDTASTPDPLAIIFAVTDSQNYMYFERTNANRYAMRRIVGGVLSTENANGIHVAGMTDPGSVIRVDLKENKYQIKVNGVAYKWAATFNVAVFSEPEDIWYNLNAAFPKGGTMAGSGGSTVGTRRTMRELRVGAYVKPIYITSTTIVEQVEGDELVRRFRFVGECDANVLNNAEVAILGADGEVFSFWESVSGAPGAGTTFDILSQPITAAMHGQTCQVALRDTVNVELADVVSVAVPNYDEIMPYAAGMNAGFVAEWNPTYREANILDRAPMRFYTNEAKWGYIEEFDLAPNGQCLSRPDRMHATDRWIAVSIPPSLLPGRYIVRYPAGMTCTGLDLSNITITVPFSGGYGEFEVTAESPNGNIRVDGTLPLDGLGGINWSIKHEDDDTTGLYFSQRFYAYMAATRWKIWRNMTPDDINGSTAMDAELDFVNAGGNTKGTLPVRAWAEISYMNGTTDLWINVRHTSTPARTLAFAQALKVAVNPLSKIYVEVSNETWNWAPAFGQHFWFRYHGLRKGYYTANHSYVPLPNLQDFIDNTKVDDGLLKVAVEEGDELFVSVSGVGWFAVRANTDLPIGTPVDHATNANWTRIASNDETWRALRRMLGDLTEQAVNIFDSEFGKSRVIPIINWQSGSLGLATEIIEFGGLLNLMTDPDRTHGSRLAHAPYWGARLGIYHTDHVPHWGAVEKAKFVSSDPIEAKEGLDGFFMAARNAIDDRVEGQVGAAAQLSSYLAGKSKAPQSIRLCSYELNWHPIWYGTTGNTWPSTLPERITALLNDDQMAECNERFAKAMALRVGNEHIWFDRIGRVPSPAPAMTDSGKALSTWLLSYGEEDTGSGNPRLSGILAAGGVNPPL